jgi:hypothetical protein
LISASRNRNQQELHLARKTHGRLASTVLHHQAATGQVKTLYNGHHKSHRPTVGAAKTATMVVANGEAVPIIFKILFKYF